MEFRKRASNQAQLVTVPGNAKQARAVVEGLRADVQELSAKLRELEANPAYRRLRNSRSSGSTLRAWDRASTLADELAAQLRAARVTLDEAEAVLPERGRATKQDLTRLTAILNGQAQEGTATRGVLAELNAMKASHEEVARTVEDIEDCASTVRQQLAGLAETLRSLRVRASSLSFRDEASIAVLDGLERELVEITPAAHADPRGCVLATGDGSSAATSDRLRRLAAGVDNAHQHLSTLSRRQAEWQTALADLRTEFAEVEQLEQECRRAEATVRTRIAEAAVAEEPEATQRLRAALAELERRRTDEVWVVTRQAIQEIGQGLVAAREQIIQRRDAAQALLEQRDELRGRLSAYRAMAIRLNHAEDLDLAAEYEHTYHLLWSGPCDLAAAAEAVASYQRAVIERTQTDDTVHTRGTQP